MTTPYDQAPDAAEEGGYARDPRGLAPILADLEGHGYTGQFTAVEGGRVRCTSCGEVSRADAVRLDALKRTEGASDPADMLAVLALRCPSCEQRGTAVLNYGPEATVEDAEVLRVLET